MLPVTILASSMGRFLAGSINKRGHADCYGSVNPSATAEDLHNKAVQVSKIQEADYVVVMAGSNNVSNGDRQKG